MQPEWKGREVGFGARHGGGGGRAGWVQKPGVGHSGGKPAGDRGVEGSAGEWGWWFESMTTS